MSKFQPSLLAAAFAAPQFQKLATLETDMNNWRQVAMTCQPTVNADYVRTVCEEIVRRAQLICQSSPADPDKVIPFLLEATRRWVMEGVPVGQLGLRVPKTIDELGILIVKMNLNPTTGEKLSARELKAANKLGRLKLQ